MSKRKTKLRVGDIVRVHNPLMPPGGKLYAVLQVDGNKAYTKFRTFNTKIHQGSYVYEFGKRRNRFSDTYYTVEEREG